MARPQKFNAEFFSHDCDMRNDIKIKNLRRYFKHEGYSLWIMLLEHLGNCDYFEYEWTDENIELLEADFDMDTDRIKEIVDKMLHYNLLQIQNGMLTCDKFTDRLNSTLSTNRQYFSIDNSIRSTRERDKLKENSVNPRETAQSRVEETKGEESTVQNSGVHESVLHNITVQNTIPEESLENSSDLNQLDVKGSDLVSEPILPSINSGEDLFNVVFEGFNS